MTQLLTGQARNRQSHRDQHRSRSWGLFVIALALSTFANFPAPSLGYTRADGPSVAIGATKRDFGDVFEGEELEQNFPVRNTGTKPLELAQKFTQGARSTTPGFTIAAAVWRPNEPRLIRTVAAKPAAPPKP